MQLKILEEKEEQRFLALITLIVKLLSITCFLDFVFIVM